MSFQFNQVFINFSSIPICVIVEMCQNSIEDKSFSLKQRSPVANYAEFPLRESNIFSMNHCYSFKK